MRATAGAVVAPAAGRGGGAAEYPSPGDVATKIEGFGGVHKTITQVA